MVKKMAQIFYDERGNPSDLQLGVSENRNPTFRSRMRPVDNSEGWKIRHSRDYQNGPVKVYTAKERAEYERQMNL